MKLPARILVTGGAGFIGSHTVDALLQHEVEVTVLDNLSTGKLTNLNLNHPQLNFIEGDVLEFPLLQELVQQSDAVLHLAAIASVPQSLAAPIYTFQVNTQGHLHVLEAIRNAGRRIPLVYASSAAVYGDGAQLPCDDRTPLMAAPLSPYALHKVHNEHYADLYHRLHGTRAMGLRYFNVYGNRQDPSSPYSGVISKFLAAYQQHQPITVFGDGLQARDFIAVQDIVQANLCALAAAKQGVLNIATGKAQTLLDLIAILNTVAGYEAEVIFAPARQADIKRSYAAATKAEQILGFSAEVSLATGLTQLYQLASSA